MSTRVDRIAIVGAGFSGTVLAANLLRGSSARATEVCLVERGTSMGRGMAYAVHECAYVLNVPANRLSADSRDPEAFLRFARRSIPAAHGEDFLPRALYGDYLQDLLVQAQAAAPPHLTLRRVFGEVVNVSGGADGASLNAQFADRAPLRAEQVVLAAGNPRPRPLAAAGALRAHPAYVDDPWVLPTHLRAEHSVLIVGNGLTMADVALNLSRHPDRVPQLFTLSRRGVVSLPQTTFRPTALSGDGAALLECGSIRAVVATTRALVRDVVRLGGDWREVVTYLRTLAPALWQRLAPAERRRFLRHVQSLWDAHRHRLPPQVAARVAELRESGRLEVGAGRIEELAAEGARLRVTWRPRGAATSRTRVVDALINATGPDYALKRSEDPLLRALRSGGLVSEDELDLGIRTDLDGACVAADGTVSDRLFYLGPMLRAVHWEATGATELRNHAERLALRLRRADDARAGNARVGDARA